MRTLVASVGLLALATSCAGATTTATTKDAGAADPDAAGTNVVTPLGSFAISFPATPVPPSAEHTQCVVKRLGNPVAIHAGTVHNVLGTGSHHLIVYRVNDATEQLTPFDCQPFTDALDATKG